MIVLSNIRKLYDGTSAIKDAVREFVDVWIEGETITAVVPHKPRTPKGSEIQRIDCSGYVVTPGLIDCHGHVTLHGVGRDDMERMNSQGGLLYAEGILYTTLVDGGVTTVRDVGGATHFLKRMIDEGMMMGPRLKIAICMLSTTGGHADFRGPDRCCGDLSRLWPPGPGRPSSIVDGPWDCRKRIREIAACGADLVKICASPGVISPMDHLEHRDFTAEEIEAICEEAAARGLYVAAHAHSHSGIALAIDHGVQDIQHISFMDEALAEKAYIQGLCRDPYVLDYSSVIGRKGSESVCPRKSPASRDSSFPCCTNSASKRAGFASRKRPGTPRNAREKLYGTCIVNPRWGSCLVGLVQRDRLSWRTHWINKDRENPFRFPRRPSYLLRNQMLSVIRPCF